MLLLIAMNGIRSGLAGQLPWKSKCRFFAHHPRTYPNERKSIFGAHGRLGAPFTQNDKPCFFARFYLPAFDLNVLAEVMAAGFVPTHRDEAAMTGAQTG